MDVEGLTDDRSLAGDDVEHTGREDVGDDLGHLENGQRCILGAFEDDRVAGGDRGGGLEGGDHQRRVPRQDAGDDAQRHALGVLELLVSGGQGVALDLTGDAAHVAEQVGQDHRLRASLGADRVAGVESGQLGELLRGGFERIGTGQKLLLAFLERKGRPLGEGLPCGFDGAVGVGLFAVGHLGDDDVAVDRGDDIGGVAVSGVDPLTADEHLPVLGLWEFRHFGPFVQR